MNMLLFLTVLFFVLEIFYFRLADRFNIIDKPNQRSSHTEITLRGGGIIFPLAWLSWFLLSEFQWPFATLGLLLLAVVSFWDDLKSLNAGIRFGSQFIAFTLLFYDLHIFEMIPWYGLLALYIVCVATLNAINFMDGINGITGMYALVFLTSMLWYDYLHFPAADFMKSPLVFLILALVVFGFFNFRKKAKCFAGDVGSVSIGYILILLTLHKLLPDMAKGGIESNWHFEWILLLTVYGIDSMFTIFQRLWNKENILQPHRKHLYQYLANELKWPHLMVAGIYAGIQMVINYLVLSDKVKGYGCIVLLLLCGGIYIVLKRKLHLKIAQLA